MAKGIGLYFLFSLVVSAAVAVRLFQRHAYAHMGLGGGYLIAATIAFVVLINVCDEQKKP